MFTKCTTNADGQSFTNPTRGRPRSEGQEAAIGHLGPHNSSDTQNAGQLTWKPLQQLPNIARRLKSCLQPHITQSKALFLLVTIPTCTLEQFSAAK